MPADSSLDTRRAFSEMESSITSSVLDSQGAASSDVFATLDEAMRAHIERALVLAHGRIEGRGGAGDLLGVNPYTLRGKMRRLKIEWSRYRTT